MPSSSTSCITPSFAGIFETSCKAAVFSNKQKKSIIPVPFPHTLLSTETSVSFLVHDNPSCSEYAYGNRVNTSLSHNENAWKKTLYPLCGMFYFVCISLLSQKPFPALQLHCKQSDCIDQSFWTALVFQPTLSNDRKLVSTGDPFSLWSVSECSPWVTLFNDSNASVSSTQTAHFCAIAYSHYRGLVCAGHN